MPKNIRQPFQTIPGRSVCIIKRDGRLSRRGERLSPLLWSKQRRKGY